MTIYAFPQPMATSNTGEMYCSGEKHPDFAGMELRDYFAAKIMQGMAQAEDDRWYNEQANNKLSLEEWRNEIYKTDAEIAYAKADAMIRARG